MVKIKNDAYEMSGLKPLINYTPCSYYKDVGTTSLIRNAKTKGGVSHKIFIEKQNGTLATIFET